MARGWRRWGDEFWEAVFGEQMQQQLRDAKHPTRPFVALDTVMLEEFKQQGALTREEVMSSAPALKWELPAPVVEAWMESARKRGLIVRRTDQRDALDRPLPAPEWELSADGQDHRAKHHRTAMLVALWKVIRVLLPLAAAAVALAKGLGVEELPSWGALVLGYVAIAAVSVLAGGLLGLLLAVAMGGAAKRRQLKLSAEVILERLPRHHDGDDRSLGADRARAAIPDGSA